MSTIVRLYTTNKNTTTTTTTTSMTANQKTTKDRLVNYNHPTAFVCLLASGNNQSKTLAFGLKLCNNCFSFLLAYKIHRK